MPEAQGKEEFAQGEVFGVNLIVNGDAEAGPGAPSDSEVVPPPGWTTTGNFTVVRYGPSGLPELRDPGPVDRGQNLFAGGPSNPGSSASQTVDVSAGITSIDAGGVTFTLSGYLGGWSSQDDNAILTVTFKGAGGAALGTASIGPVTAADRNNATGLLLRRASGNVPPNTRSIDVVLQMTRESGSYNDGYADNLSLVLSEGPLSPPQPVSPGAPQSPTGDVFGAKLIVNGDAEAGPGAQNDSGVVPAPGWTTNGNFTVVRYGASGGLPELTEPGPVDRGQNLFAGGPSNPGSSASQTVDVSAGMTSIDAGGVTFTLSGYLGGWLGQGDNAVLTVTFKGSGGATLGTASIGPVTAADRNNATGLLLRSASGNVPPNTRSIDVVLQMTRDSGSYNDGYADNLSLVLSQGPSNLPQP